METFLIAGTNSKQQEEEIEKLLGPFHIDPVDRTRTKAETAIGIEVIRDLKQQINLKPFKSNVKAVIIENAQTLTIEAQNALLKTLEEPPANTIIILLVTGSPDLLLPTILSRCEIIQLATNNSTQLTKKELEVISQQLEIISQGSLGERLRLAQDVSKDKETTLSWLADMIIVTRQQLLAKVNHSNDTYYRSDINILKSLQRTHTFLTTTNVNPRFTIENLFLSMTP